MNLKRKLLLIQPQWELSSQTSKFHSNPFFSRKSFSPPLALATLAASAEEYFDTVIWDENTMGVVTDANFEFSEIAMVGITGFTIHYNRQIKISSLFRSKGITTVIGGSGVSNEPEKYHDLFDVIFIGESERTWPKFLKDFNVGNYNNLYKETEYVDLSETPKPHWGALGKNLRKDYIVGSLQSTRGCPFCCDFCNIWRRFGRKVRTKPIDNVIAEVSQLVDLGVENVLFAVDNFAGNIKYAKLLLKELIVFNSKLDHPLRFFCEISLNIANDDELLELLAEANFSSLFIGIESPNYDSLEETNKFQNLHTDIVESCKKIMSYGLVIEGSMIVGFDNDGPQIFNQQFDFIQSAAIPVLKMHILSAFPKTSLWDRLNEEGRIYKFEATERKNAFFEEKITNIIPKQMTRLELFENYYLLLEKLYDWDNFLIRLKSFIQNITYPKFRLAEDHHFDQLPETILEYLKQFDGKLKDELKEILVLAFSKMPHKIFEIVTIISRQQTEFENLPKIKALIENQMLEEQQELAV